MGWSLGIIYLFMYVSCFNGPEEEAKTITAASDNRIFFMI
jgi:hypothetical protein